MTKSHYGSSFIISSLIYALLGFSLISFLETPKNFRKKSPEKVIKITVIRPKPKVIVPPVVVPKPPVVVLPKKIVKPKPKPKKIVKKPKPKPKPKKIIKKHKPKKVIKKHKPKKIIKQEKAIEKEYFTPAPTAVVTKTKIETTMQTPMAPQPTPTPKIDKSAEKRAFLSNVRNQIKSNKKYPKMALRRHIEGSVGVMFDIQANGQVSNIRFLNGKSILQKSVRKAITRSFPISIPNSLKSEFPMYNISVTVNFRIN